MELFGKSLRSDRPEFLAEMGHMGGICGNV